MKDWTSKRRWKWW